MDKHQYWYGTNPISGDGVMVWSNGRRYSGIFSQGKRQGKGEMTFPNGDKFTGDWVNGRRSGHGLYLFANGNRYKGQSVSGECMVKTEHLLLLKNNLRRRMTDSFQEIT